MDNQVNIPELLISVLRLQGRMKANYSHMIGLVV